MRSAPPLDESMKRFDDPTKTIHVGVGETFALALPGNPTTGHTWQAETDADYVRFLDQTHEPGGPGIGGGGQEVLRFRALAAGETELALKYKRPWEAQAHETRRIPLEITPAE